MRKLAAVWFADIVDFTAASAADDAHALRLVETLQAVADEAVRDVDGRVVKFLGDGVLAEFSSGEAAVDSALALCGEFPRRCRDEGFSGRLRIGVHLGELTESTDGDIYGDVVNVAARLQTEAEPDQVLVSDDVHRLIGRNPTLLFLEGGARSIKGKEEPIPTFVARRRYRAPTERDSAGDRSPDDGERGWKRLTVLPFQVLRPDPDVDFLAFGLPDAVSSSLMGLDSLVVRSPPPRAGGGHPVDPVEVAREADVDLVLAGTVQRAGNQVRVNAQLVDGSDGTLLWNQSSTMELGNLFRLQDELTEAIVASLARPLTVDERSSLHRDVPASGEAYELFLRANQVAVAGHDWTQGVSLYRATLEKDSGYAPAWARLGRCYRLLAKYGEGEERRAADRERAEEAFHRALELNPDLALAHSLYAQFEVESGKPVEAMIRLLRRASGHPNEIELFVGLTHAARYCGLLNASQAAHDRARSLDPEVRTSIAYTALQAGRPNAVFREAEDGDPVILYARQSLGVRGEATHEPKETAVTRGPDVFRDFGEAVLAAERDDGDAALRFGRRAVDGFPDPEGRYYIARCWGALGLRDESVDLLTSVVADGFCCYHGLRRDSLFDGIRSAPSFGALLEETEVRRAAALAAYRQEGGDDVLAAERSGDESTGEGVE